ncbi:MAG: Chemotaxis protein CheA [Betaproteobacteria bacterium ADurb.Bin341]|nr:MAG: Chemotaxis protein CheA [Betaproteobacteria bacterium ADurb.Bin341]
MVEEAETETPGPLEQPGAELASERQEEAAAEESAQEIEFSFGDFVEPAPEAESSAAASEEVKIILGEEGAAEAKAEVPRPFEPEQADSDLRFDFSVGEAPLVSTEEGAPFGEGTSPVSESVDVQSAAAEGEALTAVELEEPLESLVLEVQELGAAVPAPEEPSKSDGSDDFGIASGSLEEITLTEGEPEAVDAMVFGTQAAPPAEEAEPIAPPQELLVELEQGEALAEEATPLPSEPAEAKAGPEDLGLHLAEGGEPGQAAQTLYDIFLEEARQHLDTLQQSFAEMESNPKAPTTFAMTRAAHTLGGISATVGLMPINKVAIGLEHALMRRDASVQPDSLEGIETVRQSVLALEDMFAGLSSQIPPESQPVLLDALDSIFPIASPEVPPAADEEAGAASVPDEVQVASAQDAQIGAVAGVAVRLQDTPLLKDELDEQLLPIFLEEAQDLVQGFAEQLNAWRADIAGAEAPRALARLLHTFKGGARMAGAMNLGEMTHSLETGLEDALRSGQLSLPLLEQIESGCDTLTWVIERLSAGESLSSLEKVEIAVEATPKEEKVAEAVVAVQAEAVPAKAAPQAPAEHETVDRRSQLRVRADLVDRLVNEAGELSIARARIEGEMLSLKASLLDLTENIIRLRRQLREIEIQSESQMQARTQHAQEGKDEFDPLELDRFTRFQELTRFMAESVNDVGTVQQSLLKNLDDTNAAILSQARMTRSLQQDLMSIRMMPFSTQAERLYRIVRQTAKELGKRANLDIRGGHIELDRSVLDKIMAPVEHMLRNSLSHGIEDKSERLAAGKSEVGDILVTLSQEGNEIVLAVADDGAGLNPVKIRARAESLGLLPLGAQIEDAELFEFIFQPGFSTASAVTQIAGRGVGMDVVKAEVSNLGGRVEIVSTPGQGTTFRLYLPLTLTVMQTLMVRAGGVLYAVPSTMIEQVLEVKEDRLIAIRNAGLAEWKDNRYPFSFLPHLLGDTESLPESRRRYWILLLRSGAKRVSVLVDELHGNQEEVIKNIGPQLARVAGLAGATVLGDGRVVLILNPVALAGRQPVDSTLLAAGFKPETEAPVQEAETMPTVLVVDDSLTVRKITGRLLAREGYQVITAKDGVDALEHLVETIPDVMLSDIEMPRMDGFDLVRNVRADPRLADLPVIMITSRTAEKHRNYALEIGANEYLGKPYEEEKLLELIAGFVKQKRAS